MGEAPIVEATELRKVFRLRTADGRRRSELVAVDSIDFSVPAGGSLAIVGESGSGKTTVARMLVGLERPTAGRIAVCGTEYGGRRLTSRERRRRARQIQIVFQDPYTSLDPHQRVRDCLDEVLRLHTDRSGGERAERMSSLLEQVGLDERAGRALPRALSGGQRQRVAIARALAAEPRVLILDEAVAALDVSIQAQILNLLADIRQRTGVSYLFISHDLGVIRQVTDDVIVMRHGSIVEQGRTPLVLDTPCHPYTQLLRSSVPGPGWKPTRRTAAALAVE